jgi:hypothetical protein
MKNINESQSNSLQIEVFPTDLDSLLEDYISSCVIEYKSTTTIAIFTTAIKNFIWFCKQKNCPEPAGRHL